jgi:hypothetical protein
MGAVVRRYPCGCCIAAADESCAHVDAESVRRFGLHLERENDRVTREMHDAQESVEDSADT